MTQFSLFKCETADSAATIIFFKKKNKISKDINIYCIHTVDAS